MEKWVYPSLYCIKCASQEGFNVNKPNSADMIFVLEWEKININCGKTLLLSLHNRLSQAINNVASLTTTKMQTL